MNKHISATLISSLAAVTATFFVVFPKSCIAYANDTMAEDEYALQDQEPEESVSSIEEQSEEEILPNEISDNAELDGDGTDWAQYFIVEGNTITGLKNGGESLSEIEIPDSMGITAIGDNAFKGKNMTSIIFPSSLQKIGSEAFAECSSLKSIVIPSSVKEIKDSAFNDCSSLSEVDIRTNSIKSAGKWIFQGCKIQHLSLPDGMTVVPAYLFHQATFDNCEIVIPKSVNTLGVQAFLCSHRCKERFLRGGKLLDYYRSKRL